MSAAQAERDWEEWQRSLRQNPRYGSDRFGSDRYGSDRYGSDRIVIDDPEYADYKLKKIFADNWTAGETK